MIKVLHKMAMIIDAVAEKKRVSFSNIQACSGLNRSTVSHILTTLYELNYLDKDKKGNYLLGKKLLSYSSTANYKTILMDVASRAADLLLERINELTVVSMYHDCMRLTLVKKRPVKNLQVVCNESTNPASWYTTASGRLLLAYQDENEREKIISKISLPGKNIWAEVKDHNSLIVELDNIRQQGYDLMPVDETINSIAIPMLDADGKYGFALSCALPVSSYNKIGKEKILNHMRDVAKQFNTEIKLNNIVISKEVM